MIQIKMIQHDENKPPLYGPVFCCDWCKRQITEAQLALYKWQNDENRVPKQETLVILHKGKCDEAHNKRYSADLWPWNEFVTLVGFLVHNSNQEGHEQYNFWSELVRQYCPSEELPGVKKVADSLLANPNDRPPSINDLSM